MQIAADDQGGSSQNAGVGFAVPSNTVKRVVEDLIAGEGRRACVPRRVRRDQHRGTGAVIGTVRAGGPAAAAGLKSGDVVIAVNGKPVTAANELTSSIAALRPGDKATLDGQRGGSTLTLTVKLGTRPATATA